MDLKSIHALEVFDIRRHHSATMFKSTGRNLHIRLTDHYPA
jgi:hypothetical protein